MATHTISQNVSTTPTPESSSTKPTRKQRRATRRQAKAALPRLTSAWRLFRSAFKDFRADWSSYVKIIAVTAVPTNLLLIIPFVKSDAFLGIVLNLISVSMVVAVAWAICRRESDGLVPAVRAAYYDGSVAIIRLMIIIAFLIVMFLPAGFGLGLYSLSVTAADYLGASGPEQALVAIAATILVLPTLYMITRYGLAPLVAIREGLAPMAAMRRARWLTLGYFWPIIGRTILLGVFILIGSIPFVLVYYLVNLVLKGDPAYAVLATLGTLTAMPVSLLYMYRLYRELERNKPTTEPTP